MKNAHYILFFLLPIFFSCTRKTNAPEKIYGLDYYPLQTGRFVVYDADSTVFTEIPKDTVYYRFRIKEKIAGSFTDNEGLTAFRLERYVKVYNASVPYDSMPWRMKEVWMLNADNRRIEISEGNKRFVKMVFPVAEFASWDGNAANTDDRSVYTYEYVDQTEMIGSRLFEKVLKIRQKDYRTLISYESAYEKYAMEAGLVFRESSSLFSNEVVAGIPVEKRVENGYIYKQILVTYGTE